MKDEPLRRTIAVLLGYAAIAWVVLLFGGWLGRVLALPGLFDVLLRWGLVLGVPVAAAMAWHYPSIGHGDTPPELRSRDAGPGGRLSVDRGEDAGDAP